MKIKWKNTTMKPVHPWRKLDGKFVESDIVLSTVTWWTELDNLKKNLCLKSLVQTNTRLYLHNPFAEHFITSVPTVLFGEDFVILKINNGLNLDFGYTEEFQMRYEDMWIHESMIKNTSLRLIIADGKII